jgi:asparagine N-glycosylation enzyme membrane subunit Stt3
MFGIIASIIIAFLSMFVPGVLLALALLRKTELHIFEIIVIGFIFGLIAPATMTWLESYLISYVHAFSFSLGLFEANAVVLSLIGAAVAYKEGALQDILPSVKKAYSSLAHATGQDLSALRKELEKYERGRQIILAHEGEDKALRLKQQSELAVPNLTAEQKEAITESHRDALSSMLKSHLGEERKLLEEVQGPRYKETSTKPYWVVWAVLLLLMLLTFYTRVLSIQTTPKFFEFDPYFDMIDTNYILTYGHQLLLDPSAWPVVAAGTNHRIEPIVPYLEAYWYSLANALKFHYPKLSTDLMSHVGGIYPPITAALLVFIVFMLLYHEYDYKIGLVGAALTATMPTLLSTFVAGEQLVEPWGIMALFFFVAAYMLAVRNMKSKRLAIFAGIAFVSSFLGAHYYTVTTGVLAVYIVVQGSIELIRGEDLRDFYKMNAIIIVIIAVFLALFLPYQSTLQARIPSLLGIPFTVSAPLFALVLIFVAERVIKLLYKRTATGTSPWTMRLVLLLVFYIIIAVIALVSPIEKSLASYINLSARFTTASKPLFMTVQEYIPTGLLYNFGSQGFGTIGAGVLGLPLMVWLVCAASLILIILSILFRKSRTAVLYFSIAVPLMVAGFLEVKYLPHFGVAYIMLFCIVMGELLYLMQSRNKSGAQGKNDAISPSVYLNERWLATLVLSVGLFFVFGIVAPVALILYLAYTYTKTHNFNSDSKKLIALAVALVIISALWPTFMFGESSSIISSFRAAYVVSAAPATACTTLSNNNNAMGITLYCNTIPNYWLNAMSWINANVGPYAPRVLAWWDYGDWINWFGNSNAVLRGDNAVAQEDYAVAAQYVLGPKYNATPQTLARYMNGNQSKYVLFDQDLVSKWGALNFLGCVDINATSMQFAIQQGKLAHPQEPYALGNSRCELDHDPQYVLLPLSVLANTTTAQNINDYCSISNNQAIYFNATLVLGSSINGSVCIKAPTYSESQNNTGVFQIYNTNGTRLNAVIQQSQVLGVENIQGVPFVVFTMIYLPNAANGMITDAPSQFYNSNYYRGFFTGSLPGFTQVYPKYINGTNFVNFTQQIRIYEVDNYTGGLPPVPQKASWVHNNNTMP